MNAAPVPKPEPTPQLGKLGVIPRASWALHGEPEGWHFEVDPDPADEAPPGSPADVIIAFIRSAAEVTPVLERLEPLIFPGGALWIAWPRRAGGHTSDLTDDVIRDAALARSLVDTKVAAIDQDWSGLKLVWRVSARKPPAGT